MRSRLWYSAISAAAILSWVGMSPVEAKEGFGITKKTAALVRINPPKVFLMGTRISFKATSQDSQSQGLAETVRSQLESGLINADSRLTADASKPEVLVEVSVLQNDYNEDWQKRQETQRRQVGKDSKGKPVYQDYEVTVDYKTVSYAFRATYKVSDLVKGTNLDGDSVRFDLRKDFREGSGAPQKFDLENSGAAAVVNHVVPRLTPTREKIGVLLPKGSLESFLRLAENGLWNQYLEALEGVSVKPSPIEESYRQYALGTAYEALGYAAEDPEMTLKYLEQAASYYNRALESNPEEKFFSKPYDSFWTSKSAPAPLYRVKEALVDYRRIKDFRDNYDQLQADKAAASPEVAGGKTLATAAGVENSDAVDNEAVIRMVRSGLPDEIVLRSINGAPRYNFDVSPGGLVALAEARVSPRLIERIQEIAAYRKSAPKGKPTPKKPVSTKKPGSKGGR
jgi:hypothetical protein